MCIILLASSCTYAPQANIQQTTKQNETAAGEMTFLQPVKNSKTINDCISTLRKRNYKKAVEFGKTAVVLHSNDFTAYLCLGIAYARTGQLNFATTSIEQAAALGKNKSQRYEIEEAKQFVMQYR